MYNLFAQAQGLAGRAYNSVVGYFAGTPGTPGAVAAMPVDTVAAPGAMAPSSSLVVSRSDRAGYSVIGAAAPPAGDLAGISSGPVAPTSIWHRPLVSQQALNYIGVRFTLLLFETILPVIFTISAYMDSNLGIQGGSADAGSGNSTLPTNGTAITNGPNLANMLYELAPGFFAADSIVTNFIFTLVTCVLELFIPSLNPLSWTLANLLLCTLSLAMGALAGTNYIPLLQNSEQNILATHPAMRSQAWRGVMDVQVDGSIGAMMILNAVSFYAISNSIGGFVGRSRQVGLGRAAREILVSNPANIFIIPASMFLGLYAYYWQIALYNLEHNMFNLYDYRAQLRREGSPLAEFLPIIFSLITTSADGAFGLFFAFYGLTRIIDAISSIFRQVASAATRSEQAANAINLGFFTIASFIMLIGTAIPALRQSAAGLAAQIEMALTPVTFNSNSSIRGVNAAFNLAMGNVRRALEDLYLPIRDPRAIAALAVAPVSLPQLADDPMAPARSPLLLEDARGRAESDPGLLLVDPRSADPIAAPAVRAIEPSFNSSVPFADVRASVVGRAALALYQRCVKPDDAAPLLSAGGGGADSLGADGLPLLPSGAAGIRDGSGGSSATYGSDGSHVGAGPSRK